MKAKTTSKLEIDLAKIESVLKLMQQYGATKGSITADSLSFECQIPPKVEVSQTPDDRAQEIEKHERFLQEQEELEKERLKAFWLTGGN